MSKTIEMSPYKPSDGDVAVMMLASDAIEKCRAAGKELVMPDGSPIDPNAFVVLTEQQLEAIGLTWRDF